MELLKLKIKEKIIKWNNTPFEDKVETFLALIVLLLITIYITLVSSPLRVSAQIMPMAITYEESQIETTQVNFPEETTEEVIEEAVQESSEELTTEETTEEVIEDPVELFTDETIENTTEETPSVSVQIVHFNTSGSAVIEDINVECPSNTYAEVFTAVQQVLTLYYSECEYYIQNEWGSVVESHYNCTECSECYVIITSYKLIETDSPSADAITELNSNVRLVFYVLVILLFLSLVSRNFFA